MASPRNNETEEKVETPDDNVSETVRKKCWGSGGPFHPPPPGMEAWKGLGGGHRMGVVLAAPLRVAPISVLQWGQEKNAIINKKIIIEFY